MLTPQPAATKPTIVAIRTLMSVNMIINTVEITITQIRA
jgi:hypothetical protein